MVNSPYPATISSGSLAQQYNAQKEHEEKMKRMMNMHLSVPSVSCPKPDTSKPNTLLLLTEEEPS